MAERFPLTFPIDFDEGYVPPERVGIKTENIGEGKIYSFGSGKIVLYKE